MKFPNAVFRNTLLLLSVAVLLMGGAVVVRGQSALDGFDPNADFFVRAVAVQPDGKILIGGEFTSFSPNGGAANPRNRIARLNSDGSLDTNFNPNANEAVSVIVLQPDGKILIGGAFTTLAPNGGATVPRNRIARLNPDGSLDTNFNPNASGVVHSIAVQTDGKILVGGEFSGANSIGGQARNRIARLDATTGAADAFNPDAGGFGAFSPFVLAITVQADGKILVGGGFTAIGGQARSYIARLDPTTGLADSWNPSASAIAGSVNEIALQLDGKILVGGAFNSIGGQSRNSIARLDPVTGAADSWNPDANNAVHALAVQQDGKVLIGGDFSTVGGVTNFLARLDPVTGTPDAFNPAANERVVAIAVQSDGKVLAGGFFTNMRGETRNRIARLETDGSLDRTLNLNLSSPGFVYATAVQPDGKVLIGGEFDSVLGVTRKKIARVNPDGTLDTAFDPNPVFTGSSATVYGIAVLADGKILASGAFTSIGGQPRFGIALLNPDGTADTNFNPNANGIVYSIAVQADDKILVGGVFTSIGGQPRNYIARLDATTGAADSFNPNANTNVWSIEVQADGKILAGGGFTSIGGTNRNYIARLDAMTGLADSFNPNANGPLGGTVYSIAVQADSKILAGGTFFGTNSIGGQTRNSIARLNATNGLADSFNPNANGSVYSIAVQGDGKVLAGGGFNTANSIGGQARQFFARLSNDTVAQQNLAVTQSTVTWTRGGSSPRLTRVTFETSTNNANYNFLGHGTATGAHWTLTNLNLPTGQNLYIRARGNYRGGNFNGSESITESVRNVFIVAQPRLNIQRSANTNVVLSWATNFIGFSLESKTNLNTNVWSVVTNTPAVSGTNNVVTNGIGGSTRFYRLRQ